MVKKEKKIFENFNLKSDNQEMIKLLKNVNSHWPWMGSCDTSWIGLLMLKKERRRFISTKVISSTWAGVLNKNINQSYSLLFVYEYGSSCLLYFVFYPFSLLFCFLLLCFLCRIIYKISYATMIMSYAFETTKK